MRRKKSVTAGIFGLGLGLFLTLILVSSFAGASSVLGIVANPGLGPAPETNALENAELMPAFLNDHVVPTVYEQGYFVGTFQHHNSTFGMEPLQVVPSVGVAPNRMPSGPNGIDPMWVLVPWWGPSSAPYAPAYDPAKYGIQEQCAPATVAVCFDHPPTINVPGLGVVPLPGHDHLISNNGGHTDEWWHVYVVLVLKAADWPNLSGPNGITSVAKLEYAQNHSAASPSLNTNLFLDFAVLPETYQVSESKILEAQEMMPTFWNGQVLNTVYEQGYFTSPINYNSKVYGMEPLMAAPAVGVAAKQLPTSSSNVFPFYVLVPWWGPASAPYAPAFAPASYGIQEMCAPATIAVCWDHPATINVPGLGTVPLPGHDHLVGTVAGHRDVWWNVVVVLVLNSTVWPSLDGSSGITSVNGLLVAQELGAASEGLPTNIYLNFAVE